jgi:hypothetical protein
MAQQTTAKVVGKTLVITMPLDKDPMPSASGKNLIVASTRGIARTDATVNGRLVSVAVNAMIKP